MGRRAGRIGLGLVASALLGIAGVALLWPGGPTAPADRPLPAPLDVGAGAGELRIVALGTSLTARYDWPARLQTALADCLAAPVRVEVVARPGASIAWGGRQAAAVLALEPDLVLIEFAINDADLGDGVGRALARDLTAGLVAELTAAPAAPQVALMTMSPATGPRGWLRPGLGRRYADYRTLAAAADVGLVDLHPRWLARPRGARELEADGLHPAAEIATQVIVPVLVDYVGRAAGRACDAL